MSDVAGAGQGSSSWEAMPFGGTTQSSVHPAGWWARVGAAIIDGLILVGAALVCYLIGGDTLGIIGYAAVALFYAPVMLASNNGQTWGKQMTGVKVINADGAPIGFGRAFAREFVIKGLLFGIIPLIGLVNVLWPLWQEEHKALHDLICGTRVIDA